MQSFVKHALFTIVKQAYHTVFDKGRWQKRFSSDRTKLNLTVLKLDKTKASQNFGVC